jgi:hypothetical protein
MERHASVKFGVGGNDGVSAVGDGNDGVPAVGDGNDGVPAVGDAR